MEGEYERMRAEGGIGVHDVKVTKSQPKVLKTQ